MRIRSACVLVLSALLGVSLLAMASAQSPSPGPTETPTPPTTETATTTPTVTETGTPPATVSPTVAPSETPTVGPGPLPPLTAPLDVHVTTEATLLDENRFPLPPERQQFKNVVTWVPVAGAPEYEISRSDVTHTDMMVPSPIARVDGGIPRFEEPFPGLARVRWCYQVRAVRGEDVGSWSDPACTVLPPPSGPSDATPQPPAVGTGTSAREAGLPFAIILPLVLLAAGSVAWGTAIRR